MRADAHRNFTLCEPRAFAGGEKKTGEWRAHWQNQGRCGNVSQVTRRCAEFRQTAVRATSKHWSADGRCPALLTRSAIFRTESEMPSPGASAFSHSLSRTKYENKS